DLFGESSASLRGVFSSPNDRTSKAQEPQKRCRPQTMKARPPNATILCDARMNTYTRCQLSELKKVQDLLAFQRRSARGHRRAVWAVQGCARRCSRRISVRGDIIEVSVFAVASCGSRDIFSAQVGDFSS